MPSGTQTAREKKKFLQETIIKKIESDDKRGTIPTTFIPLSPEKIFLDSSYADVLFGVFHIMWSDMPTPRSYGIRMADQFSRKGEYLGCTLVCKFPSTGNIPFVTE